MHGETVKFNKMI